MKIFMKNKLFLTLIIILIGVIHSDAQVSGIVFRDYNGNGTRETGASYNEVGVGGVTVKAYNSAGLEVGSVISSATGVYSFTGLTLPLRIEFIPSLVDDYSAPFGTGNGSSVQFYSAASTTANFGINYPEHYCHTATPNIVTTCFVNGRPSTGTPQTDVLVQHPYFATGNMTSNTYLGDAGQLGSIWGVAYNRLNGNIYTSSLVKRHTSMKDNDGNGTEDIGAIYIKTPSGTPALWLNMATLPGVDVGLSLMPTIAARALPNSNMGPSYDGAVFPLIGKIGLGDIEISDDNTQLFVVSLYDKKLYTVDIATKTLVGSGVAIPNPCGASGTNRPFSVTYHRGKVYVGVVCDAITSQLESDLKAYVYRLDGGTFTNILSFPLNYVKGAAFQDWDNDPTGNTSYGTKWNPWEDNFDAQKAFQIAGGTWAMIHPQPILANIEFDHDESMILVFNDRNGHQMGTANYGISAGSHGTTLHTSVAAGDILRACLNTSGVYQLEVNGSCGGTSTAGAGNSEGPATINGTMNGYTGTGGEYYWGDQALIFGSIVYHHDAVMGGSTILAGSNKTYVHIVDAYEAWGGGSYLLNNTTGNFDNAYGIYPRTVTEVLFGKANGLGDPEVMCSASPIEIGNRVWNDANGNGIQDPNESPIQGVTVELVKSGSVIATAITDATGNYYFSNGAGTNTSSAIYNITQLMPNMQYTVRIPNVQGGSKQSVLGSNTLTTANVGGSGQPDVRDSDGNLVGNNAEATVLTTDIAVAGANNHTFDFGFSPVLTCSVSLTAVPGTCNPANNQYSVTGNITFTNPPSTGTLTVSVGAVTQVFNAPFTSPQAYTLSGLTSDGASHTVTVVFSADGTCTSSVTYTAPVNCTPNSCSISLTATPGTCNSANNQYSITGSITFANAPTTGTLTVSVGAVSQTFNAPFTSPQPYTLSGLTSDGSSHTVTAIFSADGSCTSSVTYTAPSACGCNNTPYPLCPGESYTMTAQSGYQNYQWYTVSGTTETQISGATNQTYTVTATGIYKWKATDGNNCPVEACCQYEFVALNCIVCDITNVGLSISNCDNKGTLTNSNDDEYTFTLNPTGTDLGTTYTVTGLPNSPQTGTYGSPTTFGPYLISGGILNITVSDNTSTSCTQTATVAPPASCSSCNVSPPVLVVTDNICPSRTGAINVVQGCGSGSFIQYSVNNGNTWSTVKPIYSTSPITIMTRCVYSLDTVCKSAIATVSTNPNKCPSNSNDCSLVANSTINPCNDNGTDNIVADDYFTIQINANVTNGGSFGKYEVVFGADPNTGAGGNVLNSGGTTFGSPITIGGNKIFLANGKSTNQLVVRDINNNTCYQLINIPAVNPCSTAPPKSPCYPVPCVPIGVIKN